MAIVSSIVSQQSPQVDGRIWVYETHTDQLGVTYPITWLCSVGTVPSSLLTTHATNLWNGLVASEIAANITAISTLGMYATPALNYSNSAQNAAALVAWWPTATQTAAIFGCEYINTLSNAVIESVFGFSPTLTATIRANYLVPGAAMAAAIRAAVGV